MQEKEEALNRPCQGPRGHSSDPSLRRRGTGRLSRASTFLFPLAIARQLPRPQEITAQARKYAKAMRAPLVFCSAAAGINVVKVRATRGPPSSRAGHASRRKAPDRAASNVLSASAPSVSLHTTPTQLFSVVMRGVFSLDVEVEQRHEVGEPILEY
jgi:hypothetical protein